MTYVKTESGQVAFRERSALFSVRQRAAFIMFDGVKAVEQVLSATSGLGVTQLDIEHMVTRGFLMEAASGGAPSLAAAASSTARLAPAAVVAPAAAPSSESAALSAPGPDAVTITHRTAQERYSQAKPLATQLTASLGLRGFMLNLGVESANGYDDLLALFPKIQSAVGATKCVELERVLIG